MHQTTWTPFPGRRPDPLSPPARAPSTSLDATRMPPVIVAMDGSRDANGLVVGMEKKDDRSECHVPEHKSHRTESPLPEWATPSWRPRELVSGCTRSRIQRIPILPSPGRVGGKHQTDCVVMVPRFHHRLPAPSVDHDGQCEPCEMPYRHRSTIALGGLLCIDV